MINAAKTRPSIFVGSSSEGIQFARAVRTALEICAEITVWDEGVFQIGQTFLESLSQALSRFDFAVLVLTPDDIIQSRSSELSSPRDNIIFELGLFMGRLGRGRTFIIQPGEVRLKIPSDLAGITTAHYYWPRADDNHRAAVASACDLIAERVRALGCRKKRLDEIDGAVDGTRVRERAGVLWTKISNCEIRIVNGRLEEYPSDDATAVVLPCNEYFDDQCAYDTRSALGAYVNNKFPGRVDEFIECSIQECRRRLGPGSEQQKTADERAVSFGAGRAVLLPKALGSDTPIALISTTTQRAGYGLSAKSSFLFEGVCELVKRLVDARLHDIVMPILGAGHGRIGPAPAFVSLLIAIAEALHSTPGGSPLRSVTVVVFQKDANSLPQVHRALVERTLALVGSPDDSPAARLEPLG